MLVLTRRVGERLRLGDDITVTVASTAGGVVYFEIEAPPLVPVRVVRPGEGVVAEPGGGNTDGRDGRRPH